MTLQNITISTVNNSDLYFIKADGSDFIQAPISETTHIGVLRYAPTEAGLYQGEVYANASALKQYQKFPVALTALNVLTVDVFVSITDPEDDPDYAGWFQVGKGLSVVGTAFGLLESDVPVGTDIWVMVRDSVNAGVYDIHTVVIVPTMEFDTPIELVAGVQKAVTGTSNYIGQHIDLESRLSDQDPEDEWTLEGQATVDEFGVWSVNVTIASAGTRDFRVIDENLDPAICSAQVDDVDVANALLTMDATCVASETESLETILEIQTMDATCVASAPTSI